MNHPVTDLCRWSWGKWRVSEALQLLLQALAKYLNVEQQAHWLLIQKRTDQLCHVIMMSIGLFDFMRYKDQLPPDKSNAFWLEHLSDFDRSCSHLTITCAIKVPWEPNETSRLGQALQLLKIGCESFEDDTLYSHWSDWWQAWRVLRVYCNNKSVFYNSNAFLV